MTRFWITAGMALSAAAAADAHFVFVIPDDAAGSAKLVFSDRLAPDGDVDVAKIADTKLAVTDGKGTRPLPFERAKGKPFFTLTVPGAGGRVVAGTTEFGVLRRGSRPAFRLRYHPRAVFGPVTSAAKPNGRAPVEIVPFLKDGRLMMRAYSGGSPLNGAVIHVWRPGQKGSKPLTADAAGEVGPFEKPGLYAARVNTSTEKSGTFRGKPYTSVRDYATVTIRFARPD